MTANQFSPSVDVCWLDLDRSHANSEYALAVLTEDERQRALRFRFERDRNMYVQVRAALRRQLAEYLDMASEELRFVHNDAGKPRLGAPCGNVRISFNVSHSGSRGLLAFGFGCCIGVDVEVMRPELEFEALARHSFSAHEQRQLQGLERDEWMAAFYRCWTRKEAYIKALGDGVSYGLDRFDVSLDANVTEVLADRNTDRLLPWTYSELPLGDGYAAVVIANARDYRLVARKL